MFTVIVDKNTKLILQTRLDTATVSKMTLEQIKNGYCLPNGVDLNTVEVVETQKPQFDIVLGKHIFNGTEVVVDPNWIEPPAVETQSIPVSDPGAA